MCIRDSLLKCASLTPTCGSTLASHGPSLRAVLCESSSLLVREESFHLGESSKMQRSDARHSAFLFFKSTLQVQLTALLAFFSSRRCFDSCLLYTSPSPRDRQK